MKNMKIYKFLLAFLIILPFLQSCQQDIASLDDPREAITGTGTAGKEWRVTDNDGPSGAAGYTVKISKNDAEPTQIKIANFHGWGTQDVLYATMAGLSLTIIQKKLDGIYTVVGNGANDVDGLITSDFKHITFEYTYDTGDGPVNVTANYGPMPVPSKKKTTVKPAI